MSHPYESKRKQTPQRKCVRDYTNTASRDTVTYAESTCVNPKLLQKENYVKLHNFVPGPASEDQSTKTTKVTNQLLPGKLFT